MYNELLLFRSAMNRKGEMELEFRRSPSMPKADGRGHQVIRLSLAAFACMALLGQAMAHVVVLSQAMAA